MENADAMESNNVPTSRTEEESQQREEEAPPPPSGEPEGKTIEVIEEVTKDNVAASTEDNNRAEDVITSLATAEEKSNGSLAAGNYATTVQIFPPSQTQDNDDEMPLQQNPMIAMIGIVAIKCSEEGDGEIPPASLWVQVGRGGLFCIFALFVMCFCLNITTARMPDPKTNPQLPDLMFALLPKQDFAEYVDMMLSSFMVSGFVLMIRITYEQFRAVKHCVDNGLIPGPLSFTVVFDTKYELLDAMDEDTKKNIPYIESLVGDHWNSGAVAMLKYGVVYGLSTFGRILSTLLTSLPTPNNDCAEGKPHINNWFLNGWKGFVTAGGGSIHCGDLLYSGHSIGFVVTLALYWRFGIRIHWICRYIALGWILTAFVIMLMSRSHYSDDILFAFYVTWTLGLLLPDYIPRPLVYVLFPLNRHRRMNLE